MGLKPACFTCSGRFAVTVYRLRSASPVAKVMSRAPHAGAERHLRINEVITKFYNKRRWHYTETTGWFHINIELALAEKHFDAARMYLDMLKKIDDNPVFDDWEDVIAKREIAHRL